MFEKMSDSKTGFSHLPDCLRCSEDKVCCLISSEDFNDFQRLDVEQQALITVLIHAGCDYDTAMRKVIKQPIEKRSK